MADCSNITGTLCLSCENIVGGVVKMYLADAAQITGMDLGSNAANGYVTDIQYANTFTSPNCGPWYEFAFNPETSDFTENEVINLQTSAKFWDQTVNLVIPKRDVAKRNQIALMATGRIKVIVKDAIGTYWLMGRANDMYVSKIDSASGVKKEDGSSYKIELKSIGEYDPAPVIAVNAAEATPLSVTLYVEGTGGMIDLCEIQTC